MFSISLNGIYTNNMNGKKMFGWDLGKKRMGFPELVPGALLVFKLYKNMWMKPKTG